MIMEKTNKCTDQMTYDLKTKTWNFAHNNKSSFIATLPNKIQCRNGYYYATGNGYCNMNKDLEFLIKWVEDIQKIQNGNCTNRLKWIV